MPEAMKLQEVMPRIEQKLAQGESVQLSPMGNSMLPLLRGGRDTILLSPLPPILRKYDVVFYRRDSGVYVMHRIVRVRQDRYACCGDNQWRPEGGLRHDQMLAVMTAFIRDGKFHTTDEWGYRLYSRWIHDVRRVQRFLRRLLRQIRHFMTILTLF